jgi:O-methyltransferase
MSGCGKASAARRLTVWYSVIGLIIRVSVPALPTLAALRAGGSPKEAAVRRFIMKAWFALTYGPAVLFILSSDRHELSALRKLWLGWRMLRTTLRVQSGTGPKTHLAMALKILETPRSVEGVVVECGAWKGASAANLSLACKIAGRRLVVFDSFEGLPQGVEGDREASSYQVGDYRGALEEVKANVKAYGAIDVCDFRKGWFDQTLPVFDDPVILAFLDVDLEASLVTCVENLWPRLVDGGYVFTDEMAGLGYCSLFWSERWWREQLDSEPPGLVGSGTGLALGEFYIGPRDERSDHPLQHVTPAAYTRKGWAHRWTFYPDG